MNWKVEQACVVAANGDIATFDHPIREAREAQGVLVVVLDPGETAMTENVFGVSGDGRLLWQIKSCPTNSGDVRYRYTNIIRVAGNTVWIDNTSEVASAVNVRDGTIWDHENRPKKWKIAGNEIIAPNGKRLTLEYPVRDAKDVDGVLVVVLDVPPKASMRENVFGISTEARILWQIEPFAVNSANPGNQYVGITGKAGHTARVYNGNGFNSAVDVYTGKLSDHRFVK